MNAYQIAKDLFYTPKGKQNALYKALNKLTKWLDSKNPQRSNAIPLHTRLSIISAKIIRVEIEQKRTASHSSQASSDHAQQHLEIESEDDFIKSLQASINEANQQEEKERSEQRIKAALGEISSHLTKLCEYSYSNEYFYQAIETSTALTTTSRKKWRAATASFYPFLHVQRSGSQYHLLTMTVAKMMTRHKCLIPRDRKGRISWGCRDLSIKELATDKSPLIAQTKALLAETPTHTLAPYDHYIHLFNSHFIFFIDESDAAKSVIAENLCSELEDKGVIQAIGAFAKEVADVVGNRNHSFLADRIRKSKASTLFESMSSLHNNDALARILAKESILLIRKKIYEVLLKNDWIFADNETSVNELFDKTNIAFIGSLTAPYCTVLQSIDSEVFQSTSAFGGEMYGFTSSKKINNLCFVNMGNSFSIMTKEAASQLPKQYPSIPLAHFFLLLTEIFLYFRLISKDRGSPELDAKHANEFNHFIYSNNAAALLAHIDKFHKKKKGALSGIGAPFRPHNPEILPAYPTKLHTIAAHDTLQIIQKMITQEQFQQAFSDDKDLIHLIDDDIQSFSAPEAFPIDLYFSHKKGHTIYGMTQVHDARYPIASNRHHVAFPLMFRAESPEQFIADLVHTHRRKNGVFLMSATGGFKNNHVSAFSLESLEQLLELQSPPAQLLAMRPEDYDCVTQMQQLRKAQKTLHIERFKEHIAPLSIKTDLHWNGSRLNEYKINELNHITKALHHIYIKTTPHFALALAQTHRHFTRYLLGLSQRQQATVIGNSEPSSLVQIDCLFSSHRINADTEEMGQEASYAIFLSSNPHGPSTLIVCYAAALDKALESAFRSHDKNPFLQENRLKKVLGFRPGQVPKGADSPDVNPMDYLLTEDHGHHVLIVSAYQSAARGINLIVNNQSAVTKKRDLDALFICAVPFYSELKTNITTDSLHPTVAQRYFFHRCRNYFYRIEELARRAYKAGAAQYTSEDIDLFIAKDDFINAYFLEQHQLALMSSLMQGIGRIERTSATQTQYLYITAEVEGIINDGMQAARKGLSRKEKMDISKGLSMVNMALFDRVFSLQTAAKPDPLDLFKHNFDPIKGQLLSYCKSYREAENNTVYTTTLPFIRFYQAFRSEILWTEGRAAYLEQLRQAITALPEAVKPLYSTFVDQLYIEQSAISIEEFDALYTDKPQAKVNPYYEYNPITKKYCYAAPWFLADMAGNYGEMVLHLAIKNLSELEGFKHLLPEHHTKARRCYEIADCFIQLGEQVLAVDAKHYRHLGAFNANSSNAPNQLTQITKQKEKRKAIQKVFDTQGQTLPTKLVWVNVYSTESQSAGYKPMTNTDGTIIPNAYLIAVGSDPRAIAFQLFQLLQP